MICNFGSVYLKNVDSYFIFLSTKFTFLLLENYMKNILIFKRNANYSINICHKTIYRRIKYGNLNLQFLIRVALKLCLN